MGAALIGVIGALLGSFLTYAAERWSEQRRWAREERTRFHAERLEAYSQLLALAQVFFITKVDKAYRGELPPTLPEFYATEVPAELMAVIERVSLLASTLSVRQSAQDFDEAIRALATALYEDNWQAQVPAIGPKIFGFFRRICGSLKVS